MTFNEKELRKLEDDRAKKVTEYLRRMDFAHSVTYATILSTEVCDCEAKDWVTLLETTGRCPNCDRSSFRTIRNTSQFEFNWFGCGQPNHSHNYLINDEIKDEQCGARLREDWLADSYQLLIMAAANLSEWMLKLSIKDYDATKNYEHIFRLFLKRTQDALTKSDGANLRPWEVKMIKEFYDNTSPQERMNLRVQMILSPFLQAATAQLPYHNDVLWELLRWDDIPKIAKLRAGNLVTWLADKWFLSVPMTENVIVNTTLRELHKATRIPIHKDPFIAMKMDTLRFLKKAKFKKDIPTLDREDHSKPGTIIKAAVDSQGIFPSAQEYMEAKQRFATEVEQAEEAAREREEQARRQQEVKERNDREIERKKKELEEEARLRNALLEQQQERNQMKVVAADDEKRKSESSLPEQKGGSSKFKQVNEKRGKSGSDVKEKERKQVTYGATDYRERQKKENTKTNKGSGVQEDDEEDHDVLHLDVSEETERIGMQQDSKEDGDVKADEELRIIRFVGSSPGEGKPQRGNPNKESWTTKENSAPTKKTSLKANRVQKISQSHKQAEPSKIVQEPYRRDPEKRRNNGPSATKQIHEARKARLEPHLLKTTTATQDGKATTQKQTETPATSSSKPTTTNKSSSSSQNIEATPKTSKQVALLSKKSGLEISKMDIYIPRIFDDEWRDGIVTPPLYTSSSYKIFSPEKTHKQLAITSSKDASSPANSNEFNLGLLDESAGSLVDTEGEKGRFKANLSDIDELLEDSVADKPAVNKEENFKFVPTGVKDQGEIEELQRKERKARIQRPKKINAKLQIAIKKGWKDNSTTLVKQKGRKGVEKGTGTHKVQKLERTRKVYAAIEQETVSQSGADEAGENMEIDEDVPLSIPMTSNEIRERVIKNEIKRGKEGKNNEELLQIDDMMEIEDN